MDEYKNVLKSKDVRFFLLKSLRFVPSKPMLKLQYRIKFKRKLNLKDPQRFTEKIQWYKLYYKDELMVKCSDKYTVRKYVRSKGLEHILNELYCVFEKSDDIDLSVLPDKFVLKLSNASGANYICTDKSAVDEQALRQKFKRFECLTKANAGREWPYMRSKPVIVAEKLLEDPMHYRNAVNDYKIFCFDGVPTYIICVSDRYTEYCNHLVYDTDWNKINAVSEGADLSRDVQKPENLSEMLDIAHRLSEDFPFARIDLYSLEGKTIFGEITFYPWSGYMEYEPDSFDFELGKHYTLPAKRKG